MTVNEYIFGGADLKQLCIFEIYRTKTTKNIRTQPELFVVDCHGRRRRFHLCLRQRFNNTANLLTATSILCLCSG